MHSMVISTIIAFFICNTLSLSLANNIDNNETDICSKQSDCYSCVGIRGCAMWYCRLHNGELSHQFCTNTSKSKPIEACDGNWSKQQTRPMCDSFNTTDFNHETKNVLNDKPEDYNCPQYKDCETCFGNTHCAFWWCDLSDEWTGAMFCEKPGDPKPTSPCEGKWEKLQRPNTCADIHKKNTTTTTLSPETTTPANTTTAKTTTILPITSTSAPEPEPHNEGEGKLNGWTIAGITISSILVVLILVGVSYKKVTKLYRARNPYHTLND